MQKNLYFELENKKSSIGIIEIENDYNKELNYIRSEDNYKSFIRESIYGTIMKLLASPQIKEFLTYGVSWQESYYAPSEEDVNCIKEFLIFYNLGSIISVNEKQVAILFKCPLKSLIDAFYNELQRIEQKEKEPEEMFLELEEFKKKNQEWLEERKRTRNKSQE